MLSLFCEEKERETLFVSWEHGYFHLFQNPNQSHYFHTCRCGLIYSYFWNITNVCCREETQFQLHAYPRKTPRKFLQYEKLQFASKLQSEALDFTNVLYGIGKPGKHRKAVYGKEGGAFLSAPLFKMSLIQSYSVLGLHWEKLSEIMHFLIILPSRFHRTGKRNGILEGKKSMH